MVTLSDYINQVQVLVHDTNGNDFSIPVLTNFINAARTRVALDTHCVRTFFGANTNTALNTIPEQETYNYNGVIAGLQITSQSGIFVNPIINIDQGAGGPNGVATAIPTLQNGVITDLNMTNWGSGYTFPPVISVFDDPSSTGSIVIEPILLYNVLDILSITIIWGDERIMCDWAPFTMFQALFRQFTNVFSVPSVFTMHQGMQQLYLYQVPDQAYKFEMDVITLPQVTLSALNDVETDLTLQYTDAVQFYAAHLCMASLQNLAMADYWYSGDMKKPGKYDLRIKQFAATAFSRRIFNPYRAFAKRLRRM